MFTKETWFHLDKELRSIINIINSNYVSSKEISLISNQFPTNTSWASLLSATQVHHVALTRRFNGQPGLHGGYRLRELLQRSTGKNRWNTKSNLINKYIWINHLQSTRICKCLQQKRGSVYLIIILVPAFRDFHGWGVCAGSWEERVQFAGV